MNYTTAYTYNLAGQVVNMTYPSGRVVKHEYDAIGRVQHVKNNSTGATYAGSATYSAANQLTGFSYLNGISASFGYSATRLQLASVAYTQSSTNLLSLSYNYDQDSGSGVKNNGQIAGISDNVQSGRSATYTYDARKRLATAGTSGSTGYPQWGLSWTYDDYGNRTAQSVTAGSGPSNSVTVSTSTNRITAMGGYTFYYDSNGNLTQDDLYKYKYDAENRLVEVKNLSDTLIATYAFDGNSLRTIKVVGADRTWYLYNGTTLIAEFEDAASATYSSGTNPGGAGSDSGALFLYQHGDHLTTRLTTDQQGNVSNEQAHYPYGESWYAAGTADPSVERKFTSYLKDSELATGRLSYAVFSEHSARVARFLTPDSAGGGGTEGSALNGYAYSSNNPILPGDGDQPGGPDDRIVPTWAQTSGGVLGCNYGMTPCGRKWPLEREQRRERKDECGSIVITAGVKTVPCNGRPHLASMTIGGGDYNRVKKTEVTVTNDNHLGIEFVGAPRKNFISGAVSETWEQEFIAHNYVGRDPSKPLGHLTWSIRLFCNSSSQTVPDRVLQKVQEVRCE